jgi:hypothetical protein
VIKNQPPATSRKAINEKLVEALREVPGLYFVSVKTLLKEGVAVGEPTTTEEVIFRSFMLLAVSVLAIISIVISPTFAHD